MTYKEIISKLESIENQNGESWMMSDEETAYLTNQASHGCRPGHDGVWDAPAIAINEDTMTATSGTITWDFEEMDFEDAGNFPWDEKERMDWEPSDTFDMKDEDDLKELSKLI